MLNKKFYFFGKTVLILFVFCCFSKKPQAQSAQSILSESGITIGLCIHVGVGDGSITSALHNQGRMLVQGISTKTADIEATRAKILTAKVNGLVSVELVESYTRLPYADDLANLVVADLDAISNLSLEEVKRITAPFGVSYVKQAGTWKVLPKSIHSGMDEWNGFFGNPEGNQGSYDELAGPSTHVKWIAGRNREGSHIGYRIGGGLTAYVESDKGLGKDEVVCRDAFNGTLMWRSREMNLTPLAAGGGYIFGTRRGDNKLIGKHGRTGLVKVYENAPSGSGYTNITFSSGKLIHTFGGKVTLLSPESGEKIWQQSLSGNLETIVSREENQLYCISIAKSLQSGARSWSEGGGTVTSFDFKTGEKKWSSGACGGVSQAFYHKGKVIVFNAGSGVCALNASNGSKSWFTGDGGKMEELVTARAYGLGNRLIWTSNFLSTQFDINTGKKLGDYHTGWGMSGDHSRAGYGCQGNSVMKNYALISGAFIDESMQKAKRYFVTRGSCGRNWHIGYGMVWSIPTMCHCALWINYHGALSSEKILEPVADNLRLKKGTAYSGNLAKTWPAKDEWPEFMSNAKRTSTYPSSISLDGKLVWSTKVSDHPNVSTQLKDDWMDTDLLPGPVSAPTVSDGKVFVGLIDQSAVVALDAQSGKQVWRFDLGGGVDSPPTIYHGLVIFGSRNGHIYAVRSDNGALVWDFLAAPYDQRTTIHSHIESRWPAYGTVTMVNGSAFVTAGRHQELGGGIYLWELDPFTGAIRKKNTIKADLQDLSVDAASKVYKPWLQHDVLVSDGKILYMSLSGVIDPLSGAYGVTGSYKPKMVGAQTNLAGGSSNRMVFGINGPIQRTDNIFYYKYTPISGYGPIWGSKFAVLDNKVYIVGSRSGTKPFLSCWKADLTSDDASNNFWSIATEASAVRISNHLAMLVTANAVVVGGKVSSSSTKGRVAIYSKENGSLIKSIDLDSWVIENGLAAAYGKIYVTTADGNLQSFGLDDPTPPVMGTANAVATEKMSVVLNWEMAKDAESPIFEYRIYRDNVFLGSTKELSFTDLTVSELKTYKYEVTAINGAFTESPRVVAGTVTALADNVPPKILMALGDDRPSIVRIKFSEKVDSIQAELVKNYSIKGLGPILGARISPDHLYVELNAPGLTVGEHSLLISGIQDQAKTPNTMNAATPVSFNYKKCSESFTSATPAPDWTMIDKASGATKTSQTNTGLTVSSKGTTLKFANSFGGMWKAMDSIFDVTIKIESLKSTSENAQAGFIFAKNLSDLSQGGYGIASVTAKGIQCLFDREREDVHQKYGHLDIQQEILQPITFPVWLRIIKVGSLYTIAYRTALQKPWVQAFRVSPQGTSSVVSQLGLFTNSGSAEISTAQFVDFDCQHKGFDPDVVAQDSSVTVEISKLNRDSKMLWHNGIFKVWTGLGSTRVQVASPIADFQVIDPKGRIVFQLPLLHDEIILPVGLGAGLHLFKGMKDKRIEVGAFTLP